MSTQYVPPHTGEKQSPTAHQHYHIVPDFFSQAAAMRGCVNEHFDMPFRKSGPSHQIWDYWYVPNLYTYMRTDPKLLISARLLHMFQDALRHWAIETLGLSQISNPYISLYVNGCGQGLHNDAKNGRWAFVYSLTNWERRKFTGGETVVFHDENYWETDKLTDRAAGSSFYSLVPAHFNQLVVFDDRVIHAVQPLQGPMDPKEGRIVIHGHIREGGAHVLGALEQEQVDTIYQEMLTEVQDRVDKLGPQYHGMMSLRLWINANGLVDQSQILVDRIKRTAPVGPEPQEVSDMILAIAQSLVFPESEGDSRVTLPVIINHIL